MPRKQKQPLRPLTAEERTQLEQVARAAGRRSGDAVAHLVASFNAEGLAAVVPGHGRGPRPVYGPEQRERILAHARRARTGNRMARPPGP